MRKDLSELSTRLSRLPGLEDLSLSTNVSLDTLKPERFRKITGGELSDTLFPGMQTAARWFHRLKLSRASSDPT